MSASVRLIGLAPLALLASCATETLFGSNFNTTAIGAAPAAVQAVGTATTFGPPGSVIVVGPPAGSSDQWLRVGRSDNGQPVAGMQGTLAALRAPGHFTFSTVLYMPAGSGLATIEFDALNPAGNNGNRFSFLHLDFTQDNHVRIDDNQSTSFGAFARNQPFDVFVGLDTNTSPPMAHISLIGAGASGTADYPIQAPFVSAAQRFDSVTLWMGFPWVGTFDATGVTVTRNTP